MNRYILEFSTGEYDEWMHHCIGVEYAGTKLDLETELELKIRESIEEMEKIDSDRSVPHYVRQEKINQLKLTSTTPHLKADLFAEISDDPYPPRVSRRHYNAPSIYTVDEWFEKELSSE